MLTSGPGGLLRGRAADCRCSHAKLRVARRSEPLRRRAAFQFDGSQTHRRPTRRGQPKSQQLTATARITDSRPGRAGQLIRPACRAFRNSDVENGVYHGRRKAALRRDQACRRRLLLSREPRLVWGSEAPALMSGQVVTVPHRALRGSCRSAVVSSPCAPFPPR